MPVYRLLYLVAYLPVKNKYTLKYQASRLPKGQEVSA